MIKTENFEQMQVVSQEVLRNWLMKNHSQKESIWLITFKKQVPEKYVSAQQVLDELLCFGWIDGIKRKFDETRTMQLLSPRRVEHWAKTYKDRFAKLKKLGLIQSSGYQSVEDSKSAGLWDFMDDVDALIIPDDFMELLKNHEPALECFNNFAPSSKRFILRWIKLSKTEITRKKRIEQAAVLASENKKIPGL